MSVTTKSKSDVTGACLAYSAALVKYRSTTVSPQQAKDLGQTLFAWLEGAGALDEANSAIAKHCVDFGITVLEQITLATNQDVQTLIQAAYTHYSA